MKGAESPTRLFAFALAASVAAIAVALVWELVAFGWSTEATAARVEADVRRTVAERVQEVEVLASRVSAEGRLVTEATASVAALPGLFERLRALAAPDDEHNVAVTVYVPGPAVSPYRVLAWSDGPGEKNLSPARLAGPAALFVAPGHAGLRLIKVAPIEIDGHQIGVAVAETVIAPIDRRTAGALRRLETAYGPVAVSPQYASPREATSGGFTITSGETPLLDVQLDREALASVRRDFRSRGLATALLVWPAALGLAAGWPIGRRRRARSIAAWHGWTAAAAGFLAASTAGFLALARIASLPAGVRPVLLALAAVAGVALTLGGLWWRPARRLDPRARRAQFVAEHLAAGMALAATIGSIRWLLTLSQVDGGGAMPALFPFELENLLSLTSQLLGQVTVAWLAALSVAAVAVRWLRTGASAWTAAALWCLPTVALAIGRPVAVPGPWATALAAGCAVAGGIMAASIRRTYQHASASLRLLGVFVALAAPPLLFYPLAAAATDRDARRTIADEYAPAVARQPQELRQELARAQADVDRLPSLETVVGATPSADSPTALAFFVWSQTSLARSRVTSDVELFDARGGLVSRFAFNLPDYLYPTSQQTRQGQGCGWDVWGEATPFGAEERLMLHAERSVCDADGTVLGGVVLHVASNDYAALPFVTSPNPYFDVVGASMPTQPARLPDVHVAVYGWSQQPLFTSGRVAWPLPQDVFDHLYRAGTPVWRSLIAEDRIYDVYFSQNRVGVYAVGRARPTVFDHASRMAEIVALMAVLFVVLQAGALIYAATVRRGPAPMRSLLQEVRTSFYRKLFLSFVAVALLPVLVAGGAFGAYMTSRFQADVEGEAAKTVDVARRVLEELGAVGDRPASAIRPTDDWMVWIRQVTGADVNYFEGSELVATSQRDLFDSGILPTRTPATVYRGIALDRRPTLVTADRIGTFEYVLAAAPVTTRGAPAILTVPLAPRQRELAAELDTLNRRVLVGVVLVILFAAGLGSSLAGRVADPVSRLTRATRQIAAGRLDVRVGADSSDEFGILVHDFNSMAATLGSQRAALARTNQLKAWNEMARQVAHEIKNPLTPVQLAAEHLRHVHDDRQRPLGPIVDQCTATILAQVRLLRQIASEFANFSSEPVSRPSAWAPAEVVAAVIEPYRVGVAGRIALEVDVPADLPLVWADRTHITRALSNLAENALQAMPSGGRLRVSAGLEPPGRLVIRFIDTGAGMDEATAARAFEPFFSTKAGGSGLGLANARRAVEREGGTLAIASAPGQGTTVTMTLPLAAAPHDGGSAPPPSR